MKKDINSLIMKPLIVAVFLMLCQASIAQHPLLSSEELNVYVTLQTRLVRLGKSANDEERTCYKWHGYFEEGVADRTGSYQTFLLPEYMAVPNSSYTYILTVIGEQYYQQEVILHVTNDLTFQVTPKRGCFSGNETPQIEDFEIVTNPPGYEEMVHIIDFHPHSQNVGEAYYDVDFELRDSQMVFDQQTVIIVNTDADEMKQVVNVPLDRILSLRDDIVAVVDAVEEGLKSAPGWYGSAGVDFPSPNFGNWTLTYGFDCCDQIKDQMRVDIDFLGIEAGLNVDGGFNIIALRAFLRGQLEFGLGLSNIHTKVFKTCNVDPPTINFGFNSAVSVGAYVEDITGGKLLSAYARFVAEVNHSNLSLGFIGADYAFADGSFSTTVYFEANATFLSFFEKSYTYVIVPERTFYVNTPIKLR